MQVKKGKIIWLTGCPCSGKTTISNKLAELLTQQYPHIRIQQLDGDHVRRTSLGEGMGFSKKDREIHIKRMAEIAKILASHGVWVICSFVSPDAHIREQIKKLIGKEQFIETYIKASQAERIKRDVKGMYKKAIEGEIKNFIGYHTAYEEPASPDILCNTDEETIEESVKKIIQFLNDKGLIDQ